MTNPAIYTGKTGHKVLNKAASAEFRQRPIPTDSEIQLILNKADHIKNEYFRLRAKALTGLLKIFGKRRIEHCLLELADVKTDNAFLVVTFTIAKKHKRGLHAYLQYLNKQVKNGALKQADVNAKSYFTLQEEHKQWVQSGLGVSVKTVKVTKKVALTDKYAILVNDYYQYMKKNHPTCKYFFPAGHMVFGKNYAFSNTEHLSPVQIWRIIKALDKRVWLHLFRKGKGTAIAAEMGRNLSAVYEVADCLNVKPQTAFHYIQAAPRIEHGETKP